MLIRQTLLSNEGPPHSGTYQRAEILADAPARNDAWKNTMANAKAAPFPEPPSTLGSKGRVTPQSEFADPKVDGTHGYLRISSLSNSSLPMSFAATFCSSLKRSAASCSASVAL